MTDITELTIPEIMVKMNLGIINRDTTARNKIPELMNDHGRKNACAIGNLGVNIHGIMTTPSATS